MAAPTLTHVRNPDDSANLGKRMQTQSETIGADVVHAAYVITRRRRKILGQYFFASTLQSVQATAHDGTATGFFWLENPVGSAVKARLRQVRMKMTILGEADMQSVPRIALARFTFTGAATGAALTLAKRYTADAANVANLRSAVTGMTVTVGGLLWTTLVEAYGITTSGAAMPASIDEFRPSVDDEEIPDFDAGEGVLIYQPDAGTAADTRRLTITGCWDEYDDS